MEFLEVLGQVPGSQQALACQLGMGIECVFLACLWCMAGLSYRNQESSSS